MVTSKDGTITMTGDTDTLAVDVSGVVIAFYEALKEQYGDSAMRLVKDMFLCMMEVFKEEEEHDRLASFQTIFLLTAEQIRLWLSEETRSELEGHIKEIAVMEHEAWMAENGRSGNYGVSS